MRGKQAPCCSRDKGVTYQRLFAPKRKQSIKTATGKLQICRGVRSQVVVTTSYSAMFSDEANLCGGLSL
jgi:hypothetical protein